MALLSHVISNSTALAEVRQEVSRAMEPRSQPKFDMRNLERQPLLLSMYAETLRLGVQIHVPRTTHQPFHVGSFTVPSKKMLFVNTWLAHNDETVWNTKDGSFPLNVFWARRFLIDSKDPSSGPRRVQQAVSADSTIATGKTDDIRYSTEGLEGAWIPYGGR